MEERDAAGYRGLEQFVLLAKTAKGAAAAELITQALEAPGVYVFGELLDSPNIKELSSGAYCNHYQLLELFTYGTFIDYTANALNLPVLSVAMTTKLKQLTLVSMASQYRTLSYNMLLQLLSLENVRQLEDLIIDAIYCGIIEARLDQENKVAWEKDTCDMPLSSPSGLLKQLDSTVIEEANKELEVKDFIGRDVKPGTIGAMATQLETWCNSCGVMMNTMECEMNRANKVKEQRLAEHRRLEEEVSSLKAILAPASSVSTGGNDQQDQSFDTKQPPMKKGLRGSARLFKS